MDTRVPLKMLKFGHEDGEGINARVVGRDENIASLAANIFANRSVDNESGLIENLIVKEVEGGFYSVANGNRRLAALRMIEGEDSDLPVPITLHQVDETKAFEYSLTTAITAEQLHPVDQYEAFARLEEHGKTGEEIAKQYGMAEKQVRQALALGRLSPKIRQAWREGAIKAEVAKAFTLALDHKTQDKVYAKLEKESHLWENYVKKELGVGAVNDDVVQLLDVVGAEAYRAAGGIVTEDLFGKSHIISDETLLKQMARQILISKCEELLALGWGWAEIEDDLPHGARYWNQSQPKALDYQGDGKERLGAANDKLAALEESDLNYNEQEEAQEAFEREVEQITSAVRARSFDAKKMKQLGCIVDIEDGRLVILYGIKKPAEAEAAPSSSSSGKTGSAGPTAGAGGSKSSAAPEEPEISNALLHRLSLQLTNATATALLQDEQLALAVLLAGFDCYGGKGVKVSVSGLGLGGSPGKLLGQPDDLPKALKLARDLKPAERISLLVQVAAGALDFQNVGLDDRDDKDGPVAICNAIDAKALNSALRGAFDAKDYFNGVNKALCLKAIEEAMGPDMARQQAKKPKGDIAAFAIENVPPTGWLPPQLRAKGYDGPPVVKKAIGKTTMVVPGPKPAKAKSAARPPAKRAAAAKKTAKKTSKKKR